MVTADFENMVVKDGDQEYTIVTIVAGHVQIDPDDVTNWRVLRDTDLPLGIVFQDGDLFRTAMVNLPSLN